MVNFSSRQNFLIEKWIQAVMLQQNRRVTIKIIQKLPTLMESKHAVTRPFWTSTWGGGCANLHSVSVRVHLLRWYSRQTSRVSHRESFTLLPIANRLFTMAITRCHTKNERLLGFLRSDTKIPVKGTDKRSAIFRSTVREDSVCRLWEFSNLFSHSTKIKT